MLSVLASFAEFEREMTATRIAEARAYLKSKGRRIAGAVPFGYAAEPRTKQLIVVPEEGEVVSTMFRWAAAKVRPSTIASYANAMGWQTRTGNPWTARQVLFTLANYVYAGLVVDGFGFRDGCHEALIERRVYHEVQNILALRRTRAPGRSSKHLPWLLIGLAYCGKCQRLLSTHVRRRGSLILSVLPMPFNVGRPSAVQECSGECRRDRERPCCQRLDLRRPNSAPKRKRLPSEKPSGEWYSAPKPVGSRSNFNPARLPQRTSKGRFQVEYRKERGVNVAIEIPDDIGRVLAGQAGDLSRAVLEAVAAEAYRSGTITPAQVQRMLGLSSRWETESFLRRAEAYHDYTMDDLERDIAAIRDASPQ